MPVNRREFEEAVNSQRDQLGKVGRRTSSITVKLQPSSFSSGSTLAQTLRTGLARSSSAYRADFVISGARVGTDNLTGAPLANELGSATIHVGTTTGSNVTPISIPSPTSPLPGVPAQLTRGSPLLGNRQVLMNFLRSSGFEGGSSQGSSINTNSVPLDSECDPSATDINFSTEDPPTPDPPLPEDQGGSPIDPGDPPPPTISWNCSPTGCVRVEGEGGRYRTLIECETFCQARYTCRNGDCIPDPNGEWANLSLCLNGCRSRFRCVSGQCVADPTGGFSTLIDCVESGCETPRWDCVGGECTLTDSSGAFADPIECRDSGCTCTPTDWTVTMSGRWKLRDPEFGCSVAGDPLPGSPKTVTVSSKSPPKFVQPTPWILAVECDCVGTPSGLANVTIFSVFPTSGCEIELENITVTPA